MIHIEPNELSINQIPQSVKSTSPSIHWLYQKRSNSTRKISPKELKVQSHNLFFPRQAATPNPHHRPRELQTSAEPAQEKERQSRRELPSPLLAPRALRNPLLYLLARDYT